MFGCWPRSNLVNFGENSSVSSFRHGVPEPSLTWMSPDASLRAWMPAVHAGMTDAVSVIVSCICRLFGNRRTFFSQLGLEKSVYY